ncbi:MAG: amidohydrolase [Deltaproteobacteria bacterium]|nr:amidohydrolase [Deltaproteobacteria bacterium]
MHLPRYFVPCRVRRSRRARRDSPVLVLGAVVVLCIGCFSADSRTDATLVVRNANVITVDANAPEATAFAVDGDRFVRVGGESEVLELAGDAARVIDLGGRTVTPGFNDAHLHPVAIPPKAVYVGPPIVTVDGIVERLREAAAEAPVGSWILGWGYEDVDLGRHLDRHDLDAVSEDRPVMVIHGSLHVFAVNSRALVTAGVSAETPEPGGGGRFFRGEDGEPTGLLTERPALEALFNEEQPSWRPRSLGDAQMQLRERLAQLYAEGVTSIGDALVPPELALVYWLLALRGEPMRASLMIQSESLTFAKWLPRLDAVLGLFGYRPFDNERLRARTVKVFHGLSVSAHTARLYEPYAKPPGYRGLEPQRSQAELEALLREIHEAGLQMAVHSNGDYEIDMVLDAIEALLEDAPREDHRHRIEHGTVATAPILARMKALDLVLAPHSYVYENGRRLEDFGEWRFEHLIPNGAAYALGIPVAGNSDYPVSSSNPMLRIQSLVTRESRYGKVYGPSQRLTVDQALHSFTMGGAFATFEEDQKGSISPGKLADFVVLSSDPRTAPPHEIRNIRVLCTFIGGDLVYSVEGEDPGCLD